MKREKNNPFSMSFLDVMACGFGALVLILLLSNFNEGDSQNGTDSFSFLDALSEIVSIQDSSSDEISKNSSLEKDLLSAEKKLSELEKKLQETNLEMALLDDSLAKNKKKRSRITTATEAGGIRIDSDYVVFIVDTSGSMKLCGNWARVIKEFRILLDAFPQIKGFQIMKDNGDYIYPTGKTWIEDNKFNRQQMISALARASNISYSNPISAIKSSLNLYADGISKVGIFVIGDELRIIDGSRPAESFDEIESLNTTLFGKKKARINAIGFLTGGEEANKKYNPGYSCKIAFEESNKSFFNFIRELTSRNDGTLVIR